MLPVIWYSNASPLVPVAFKALVITGPGGVSTTSDSEAVPVPPALLALMLTVDVPLRVGVPESKPEVVLTVRPGGRPIALKAVGLLLPVIW